jgi:hypothetical protein
MKKIVKSLLIIIATLVVLGVLYEQIILVKRYNFELEDLKVKVVADECESCFLDWTTNNTITIENKKSKKTIKEKFNTEGSQIEFGISDSNNNILINCPGFSYLIFDKVSLTKREGIQNRSNDSAIFSKYSVYYKINKQKELIKIIGSKPSTVW